MTKPLSLEEALKQLEAVAAEQAAHPDPTAGEDLPEYDPLPEADDDVSVTFVKKSDSGT